jgi:hypothetical protein
VPWQLPSWRHFGPSATIGNGLPPSMAPTTLAQIRTWALIGCVPLVALTVGLRQLYLSKVHELSTWKGGGMGMFADADGPVTRFTKIYIELPDGQRQPLTKLTPVQEQLLSEALWYPIWQNFRSLASSIRRTNWVAPDQVTPVPVINAEGKRVGVSDKSYYTLYPTGERPPTDVPDWILAIEYWKASFDPTSRIMRATIITTLRYGKGEL